MPSLTPTPIYKFLLDENVRQGLYKFLRRKNVDAKLATKGASDKTLADISKSEERILVTNDEEFGKYTKDEVYAVIWLRIPQNDEEALFKSFDKLLLEVKDFTSKLFILYEKKWDEFPLPAELKD